MKALLAIAAIVSLASPAVAAESIDAFLGKKTTLCGTWHVGDRIGPCVIVGGKGPKVYVEIVGCNAKNGMITATVKLKDKNDPHSIKEEFTGVEDCPFKETQARIAELNKLWPTKDGTHVCATGVLSYWKSVNLLPKGVHTHIVEPHYFFCVKGLKVKPKA